MFILTTLKFISTIGPTFQKQSKKAPKPLFIKHYQKSKKRFNQFFGCEY